MVKTKRVARFVRPCLKEKKDLFFLKISDYFFKNKFMHTWNNLNISLIFSLNLVFKNFNLVFIFIIFSTYICHDFREILGEISSIGIYYIYDTLLKNSFIIHMLIYSY